MLFLVVKTTVLVWEALRYLQQILVVIDSGIELNAIQRSNPEMQKRAANAVRGMVESEKILLFLFMIMELVDT